MVKWLGFEWEDQEHYASDYFPKLFEMAEALIGAGHAYVDSQSAEQIRDNRGTLTAPGKDSPFRGRSAAESLQIFREMKDGKHADGAHVARAKIDMRSPNMNLRDPVMYRIRHATHHRTGDQWCIYPTYDWAHGLSDCIEGISHSICTLEFEDHRPLYDWFNQKVAEAGFFKGPLSKQIELPAQSDPCDPEQETADRIGRADTSTAGTTRACPPSLARGGAATPRAASACSPSGSACRRRTSSSTSRSLRTACART
jgi:hypothetical protein